MQKTTFQKNIILLLLLLAAIFIQRVVKQPYGIIAIIILIVTSFFNQIKDDKKANWLYNYGSRCTMIILIVATLFFTYAKSKKAVFTKAFPTQFETTNFETALAKAKKENKKVFIDFYASWCPPYLAFANDILPDSTVGQNMNASFVNLKYDAEQGEGKIIASKYNVKAYPALMILDADGNVLETIADETVPSKEEMIGVAVRYRK